MYPKDIQELLIPLPPPAVQAALVAACEAIEVEVAEAQAAAAAARGGIAAAVEAVYAGGYPTLPLDKITTQVQYGLNEAMNTYGQGYKIFRMNEIIHRRMADNGSMKYANIPAEEFAKYRLDKGDLLFNRTNSIEHVGKTGIFTLDGDYCFASYLIRVVVDSTQALPEFVNLMMNSPAFQTEAKSKAARSINQANINATVMRNISLPVPPLPIQQQLIGTVTALEAQAATAQALIGGAAARKAAVVRHYLTTAPAA